MNLREKLDALRLEEGVVQKKYCSEEENRQYTELVQDNKPLPDGVFDDFHTFYRYENAGTTEKELHELCELCTLQNTKLLTKIKNIQVFYLVLTLLQMGLFVVALIVGFLIN